MSAFTYTDDLDQTLQVYVNPDKTAVVTIDAGGGLDLAVYNVDATALAVWLMSEVTR